MLTKIRLWIWMSWVRIPSLAPMTAGTRKRLLLRARKAEGGIVSGTAICPVSIAQAQILLVPPDQPPGRNGASAQVVVILTARASPVRGHLRVRLADGAIRPNGCPPRTESGHSLSV